MKIAVFVEDTAKQFDFTEYEYVLDCIDDVSAKVMRQRLRVVNSTEESVITERSPASCAYFPAAVIDELTR